MGCSLTSTLDSHIHVLILMGIIQGCNHLTNSKLCTNQMFHYQRTIMLTTYLGGQHDGQINMLI